MKDILIKNIHFFILIYTAFINYEIYEEKSQEVITQQGILDSAEVRLKKSTADLAKVDQFNKDLKASKARVSAVVKEIEKVQRQLPSEIRDAEVQGILADITGDLRMLNPESAPKDEVDQGFYFSKEFEFRVKGTFLQSLIFYEKLENLSKVGRILNVRNLKIGEDPDADKRSRFKTLVLQTVVESFRYNPNYRPTE